MSNRFAIFALAAFAGYAHADTVYWQAGPDTQWTNPANWIGHVPNSGDFVVIRPGAGPLVQGVKFISGLYIQPGASMVLLGELNISGGASIQGNMSIAGTLGRLVHRDDVNLEGTITMWDGAFISRSSIGAGTFTVRSSGSIVIPTYDTHGITLGTNLQVFGAIRHDSTHTLSIGQFYQTDSSSSYIAIQAGGVMTFTHGGDVAKTYLQTQTPPYIANDGTIGVSGLLSDVVDISAEVGVISDGAIIVDQPDLVIHKSLDINTIGTLLRGQWICNNYGRVLFYDNPPIMTIGTNAIVQFYNPGSTILPISQLSLNMGHINIERNATLTVNPASGEFWNEGTIMLDTNSTLQTDGEFNMGGAGVLDCWVAGTQSDQHGHILARVSHVYGELNVLITNFYAPAFPDVIPMIETTNGMFDDLHVVNTSFAANAFVDTYTDRTMNIAVPRCSADFNVDGVVDFFDYLDFVDAFSTGAHGADFNHDYAYDFFDYLDFVDAFSTGC